MTIIIVLLLFCGSTSAQVDGTLDAARNGSSVVRAVLAKIEASDAFSDWSNNARNLVLVFLRRMAYVETNDGLTSPSSGLGIWNVNKDTFGTTWRHVCDSSNNQTRQKIMSSQILKIDWSCTDLDSSHAKMSMPMYSGLAATLHVAKLMSSTDFRFPSDITDRELAKLWQTFNSTKLNAIDATDVWSKKVAELKENERKQMTRKLMYYII